MILVIMMAIPAPSYAFVFTDNAGPENSNVDKSNSPAGLMIEKGGAVDGQKVQGGLILIDQDVSSSERESKARSIVNENGVLMINIDGNGTFQKILVNGDSTDSLVNGSLTNVNIENGTFVNGDLTNVNIENGTFVNGDLINVNIENGTFVNGDLVNVNIENGTFVNGDLTNVNIENGTFVNGDLINVNIENGTFVNGDLVNVNIENGTFVNGDLTNVTVNGLSLTGASLGDIFYADANGQLVLLNIGSNNDVLSVINGMPIWSSSSGVSSAISNGYIIEDTDLDTYVNVEAAPDQDAIRFVANGNEALVIDKNGELNITANGTWNGKLIYDDGSQENGYILVSDANGEASWVYPCDLGLCGNSSNTNLDVLSLTPSNGATGINVNTDFEVRFRTSVIPGIGRVKIGKFDTPGDIVFDEDIESSYITFNNNKVTIDPPDALIEAERYYVSFEQGSVTSAIDAGIEWNGTEYINDWNFTTGGDLQQSSLSPSNNASSVASTTDLSISFGTQVARGTGRIYIKEEGGANAFTGTSFIDVNDANGVSFSPDLRTVDIDLSGLGVLEYGQTYYVEIDAGAFVKATLPAITFPGFSGDTHWKFTTITQIDDVSVSPPDSTTNVTLSSLFSVTFNHPPVGISGKKIRLFNSANTEIINIDADSSAVNISGNTATITLAPNTLQYLTSYYFLIDPGAFAAAGDAANLFTGITSTSEWTFTTRPIDNLSVQTRIPGDYPGDTTEVDNGDSLSISFNVPAQIDTGGSDLIIKNHGGANFETIPANSPNLSVSPDKLTITIDPTNTFAFSGHYSVIIPNDLIVNNGNPADYFVGYSSDDNWDFYVKPALQEASKTPANGATEVARDSDLTVNFSTNIDIGASSQFIRIVRRFDSFVHDTFPITDAKVTPGVNSISINPDGLFDYGQEYCIEMDNEAILNNLDNSDKFAGYGTHEWCFTADSGIKITSVSPADNGDDINVDENITITFNKAIQKGSGNLDIFYVEDDSLFNRFNVNNGRTVSLISSNTRLFITPDFDFDYEKAFYVNYDTGLVANALDNGNQIGGITSTTNWNFTTQDAPNPFPPNLYPLHNAADIAINSNASLTFASRVTRETGLISLYQVGVGLIQSFDVSDNTYVTFAADERSVTLNFANDFEYGEQYYITIDPGTFVNKFKESAVYSGISAMSWVFDTVAPPNPYPPLLSPGSGSVDVALSPSYSLNFQADINGGTGTINLYDASAPGSPIDSLDVSNPGEVSISNDRDVTLNFSPTLEYGKTYYIDVPNTAFNNKVKASDNFTGYSGAGGWYFTSLPALTLNSQIIDPFILNRAGRNATFSLEFDRDITINPGYTIAFKKVEDFSDFETFQSDDVNGRDLDAQIYQSPSNLKRVTFNPTQIFEYGKSYYIEIPSGMITNAADATDVFSGYSGHLGWQFAVEQSVPLDILTLTPPNNSTQIPVSGQMFTLNFQVGNIIGFDSGGTIDFYQGAVLKESLPLTLDPGKVELSTDLDKLFFYNQNAFSPAGVYHIRITPDKIVHPEDPTNKFEGIVDDTVWQFTAQNVSQATINETKTIDFGYFTPTYQEFPTSGTLANYTKVVVTNQSDIKKPAYVININASSSDPESVTIYPTGLSGAPSGTTTIGTLPTEGSPFVFQAQPIDFLAFYITAGNKIRVMSMPDQFSNVVGEITVDVEISNE